MVAPLDFDKFEDEVENKPLPIKNLLGRNWELPGIGQLPARLVAWQTRTATKVYRLARDEGIDLSQDDAEIPDSILEDILEGAQDDFMTEGLVGKKNLQDMHDLGITERQLERVVNWAMQQHMAARTADAVEADADDDEHPTDR